MCYVFFSPRILTCYSFIFSGSVVADSVKNKKGKDTFALTNVPFSTLLSKKGRYQREITLSEASAALQFLRDGVLQLCLMLAQKDTFKRLETRHPLVTNLHLCLNINANTCARIKKPLFAYFNTWTHLRHFPVYCEDNAAASCPHVLDSVYHRALRFITNCGCLTHHCV